jgi:hypothetical protein
MNLGIYELKTILFYLKNHQFATTNSRIKTTCFLEDEFYLLFFIMFINYKIIATLNDSHYVLQTFHFQKLFP